MQYVSNYRIVLATCLAFALITLNNCRGSAGMPLASEKDIADPGATGVPNRYFKLVQSAVQMADCSADQVPSPKCRTNVVFAPYKDFASKNRAMLTAAVTTFTATVNAAELPLRKAQAAAAKKEVDDATAKLAAIAAKTMELVNRLETAQIKEKTLGTQQADLETAITAIQQKIAGASGDDRTRLQQLLDANNADLATIKQSRAAAQAAVTTSTSDRDNHVRLFEQPAREFLDIKNKAYKTAFDAAVTPTVQLTALREKLAEAEARQSKLEDVLKLLIERDIPNRVNLQDPSSRYIVKELFPASMKHLALNSSHGIFDGQVICDQLTAKVEAGGIITFNNQSGSRRPTEWTIPGADGANTKFVLDWSQEDSLTVTKQSQGRDKVVWSWRYNTARDCDSSDQKDCQTPGASVIEKYGPNVFCWTRNGSYTGSSPGWSTPKTCYCDCSVRGGLTPKTVCYTNKQN